MQIVIPCIYRKRLYIIITTRLSTPLLIACACVPGRADFFTSTTTEAATEEDKNMNRKDPVELAGAELSNISPLERKTLFSRPAKKRFKYKKLKPLIKEDALTILLSERDEA